MQLFLDGVRLMIMGMGTVFLFLIIMILCMNAMAKIIAPFAHLFEPAPAAKPAAKKHPRVMQMSLPLQLPRLNFSVNNYKNI